MQENIFNLAAGVAAPLANPASSAPSSAETIYKDGKAEPSDAAIKQAAEEFEAAFITQVLIHSGLGKALTMNGGEQMQAFSSFYLEAIAKDMAAQGGLGLAQTFYDKMKTDIDTQGASNDDHGHI